jgi:hypothetical protein
MVTIGIFDPRRRSRCLPREFIDDPTTWGRVVVEVHRRVAQTARGIRMEGEVLVVVVDDDATSGRWK